MRASFRLVYSYGSEYVPTHREGRVVLTLHADGRAYLDHVQAGAFTSSWEGRIQRATLERIVGHLGAAGYPAVSRHPIPPGATLRLVRIQSGSVEAHNLALDWWAARDMPGYAEAFAILDSLVAELGGGTLSMVVVSEPGLIRPAHGLRTLTKGGRAWEL